MIELCVVLLCIGTLVALLLPMTRNSREAARRMQCQNNIKQLRLALHNYESTHGYFPAAMGGTRAGDIYYNANANRLSGFVGLLPFMEQTPHLKKISNPLTSNAIIYPPMGPTPWVLEYESWNKAVPMMLCPSYEGFDRHASHRQDAFCIGDVGVELHASKNQRGAFMTGRNTTMASVLDKSNTIAVAEIGRHLSISP